MRRTLAASSVVIATVLGLAACKPPDRGPSATAETMWKRLQAERSEEAYVGFIEANKKAGVAHANTEDREGVQIQIRYAEASADEAVRAQDPVLADQVFDLVARLRAEGRLPDYEDVLPGVTARLDACEAKVLPLLPKAK